MIYYIALGSNLGDRAENLRRAAGALSLLPDTRLEALSGIYETDPVGYADQPCFYNAVARLDSALSSHVLLGCCLGIEAAMGRVRSIKDGPRILDLDLLCGDAPNENDRELCFPHPRRMERAFVLVPLCEICEEEDYHKALEQVDRDGVRKLTLAFPLP